MADEIPIVIPSRQRSERIAPKKWLPPDKLKLFVHEREVPRYEKDNPDVEVIGHNLVGMAKIRQAIYDQFGDVFMIDDDAKFMAGMTSGPGEVGERPTPERAYALIQRLYREATEAGIYLFGFAQFGHPLGYNPMKPYRLTGVIYGLAFGVRRSPHLFWNPNLTASGDYWLSLLNAHFHRMVLMDERWFVASQTTFRSKGGSAGQRSAATEKKDTRILQEFFGNDVVVVKKGTAIAGKTHDDQRSVKLPF